MCLVTIKTKKSVLLGVKAQRKKRPKKNRSRVKHLIHQMRKWKMITLSLRLHCLKKTKRWRMKNRKEVVRNPMKKKKTVRTRMTKKMSLKIMELRRMHRCRLK